MVLQAVRIILEGVRESGVNAPTLAELEKRHILAALEHCRNNRTQAAKLLDISVRTLRNKLNEYQGSTGSGQAEAVGCSTDEDSEGDTAALPRHTRLPA